MIHIRKPVTSRIYVAPVPFADLSALPGLVIALDLRRARAIGAFEPVDPEPMTAAEAMQRVLRPATRPEPTT